jgi:hypothetical protein
VRKLDICEMKARSRKTAKGTLGLFSIWFLCPACVTAVSQLLSLTDIVYMCVGVNLDSFGVDTALPLQFADHCLPGHVSCGHTEMYTCRRHKQRAQGIFHSALFARAYMHALFVAWNFKGRSGFVFVALRP